MKTIRKAQFASYFYPENPQNLKIDLLSYFPQTPSVNNSNSQILIVPHAGYFYSGQIAASAYATLRNRDIKNVILLGVSHTSYFPEIISDPHDFWETPLGKVPVNHDIAAKISVKSHLDLLENPHDGEHSLEVQVPFLQTVLREGFQIVPILISEARFSNLENLASHLASILNPQTILVISSDLSHYPSAKVAEKVDQITLDSILSLNCEKFTTTTSELLTRNYLHLETCACGANAIEVAMLVASKLQLTARILKYANSSRVSGDNEKVVGYASLSFSKICK